MKDILKKYEEIINYLIIGFLTTLVSLGTYYILTLKIELQIANGISWFLSVTFAYFTNRKYVFKVKENKTKKEVLNFYLSRLSTLILDMISMYIFVSILKFNDKIVKLIVQILVIVLNYILSKFLVFKKEKLK